MNMNWIELASAVGVGGLLVKFLEIKYLHPILTKQARSEWLREKRFQAFDKLTKNLLAFGMENKDIMSVYDSYAVASEAFLLADSRATCKKIDNFMAKRQKLDSAIDKNSEMSEDEIKALYDSVYSEARSLVADLRLELREDEL